MEAKFKECTKPHALAHSLTGAGVALLAVALIPKLGTYALIIGAVALIGGVAWDFLVNPGK